MHEAPVLCDYQTGDRDAVFDFIREVYPANESAYLINQWEWKFEANPFTPATGSRSASCDGSVPQEPTSRHSVSLIDCI
jgi:hypothetical protein